MTRSHHLESHELVAGYGSRRVIEQVDLSLPAGQISAIIGANACGKSTLLKTLSRLLPAQQGTVVLDGKRIDQVPTRELARTLGLLPQQPIAPEGIVVADLVGRGRHPHQRLFRAWDSADDEAVFGALELAGVADLQDRPVDELSGGQRQRVWIAMALAQETDLLLLDEPTTFLDVAHQIEVLDLLTDLNRRKGTTIAMVLHEVNLAARYADHIFALREGKLIASGPPAEVVTADLVRQVFDLDSLVIADPVSGAPMVLPRGRHHVQQPEVAG